MNKKIKILHLEDSGNDAELIFSALQDSGLNIDYTRVYKKADFINACEKKDADIILADYSLPQFNGVAALEIKKKILPEIPLIIVSGTMGDEMAADTIKLGATDYVLKNNLNRLIHSVKRALKESDELKKKRIAEINLLESEKKYRKFFNEIPIPTWVYDKTNRKFVNVNKAALSSYGYSREEFLSMSIADIKPDEDIMKIMKAFYKEKDNPAQRLWKHKKKNGEIIDVELIAHDITMDNGDIHSVVIANDISGRIKTQRAIKRADEKFRLIFENAAEGIVQINREGKILEVNPSFLKMLGYKSRSELISQVKNAFTELFSEQDEIFSFTSLSSVSKQSFETKMYKKNGDKIWVLVNICEYVNPEGEQVLEAITDDITKRKTTESELENALDELSNLFESLDDVVFSVDSKGNIIQLSHACEKLLGYTHEELTTDTRLWNKCIHPEDAVIFEETNRMLEKGQSVTIQYRIITKNRETKWVESKMKPILDYSGKLERVSGITSDISTRIAYQTAITKSLEEKDLLLKEIHHRVKNNLQIISSLIKLQSEYIDDKNAKKIFLTNRQRILSIALVHQKLYMSKSFSRISFDTYLKQLTGQLLSSFGERSNPITIDISCDEIFLNIETSVPFGLIINELVSNSVKHAFPGMQNGKITIEVREKDGECTFKYFDNGVGISPDVNLNNPNSLGLQLIHTLTSQLDAAFERIAENGSGCMLTFKELNYRQRI
jgi:PAS domain S-box-containing protein